jgi:ubiquitin-conjugating enzyme E2 G1
MKELQAINDSEDALFSAGLVDESNPYEWALTIEGPQGTIYDGFYFQATLTFPQDYPMQPPKMNFQTRMHHPNIFKNGDVCISILNTRSGSGSEAQGAADDGWKPCLGATEVVLSVISLLTDPNHHSPANSEASREYRTDFSSFKRKVHRYLEELI